MELEYKTASGKTRIWRIEAAPTCDSLVALIRTTHGELGGALQTVERKVKGKNIGKVNETSALEQARREAAAKYKLKSEEVQNERRLPMLAHSFLDAAARAHLELPCFAQPKLDGVRALFDGVNLYSRKGNIFPNLEHILKGLRGCDLALDGELYSDTIPFEDLAGLLKKKKYDARILDVKYHIFDYISEVDFEKRLKILRAQKYGPNFGLVETSICFSLQDIEKALEKYESLGFEGIMLRNKKGAYKVNARSYDLLKYKKFVDEEFPIVDYERENNSEAIVWVCKTPEGKEFNVKPEGTHASRALSEVEAGAHIGKLLTVKYQELTKHGVPRFPVGRLRID